MPRLPNEQDLIVEQLSQGLNANTLREVVAAMYTHKAVNHSAVISIFDVETVKMTIHLELIHQGEGH